MERTGKILSMAQLLDQVRITPEEKPSVKKYSHEMVVRGFLERINKIVFEESKGKKQFIIDDENEKVINKICQYLNNDVEGFEENEKFSINKGICIAGNYGSGKSLIMKAYCVTHKDIYNRMVGNRSCNSIIDDFTKVDKLLNCIGGVESIRNYYDPKITIERVFDDAGAEHGKVVDYGTTFKPMEIIFTNRYELFLSKGVKTHITTNLTQNELIDFYGARLGSRFWEMFNFFTLGGSVDSKDYRQ